MMFNATFNNIQWYRGGQFYWWWKPEYQENWFIDWLVFYANFSNISAISWRDKILLLQVYTYKFIRNKT